MCGAYGFTFKQPKEIYDRFDIENTLDSLEPRFNARPGQKNPVITSNSPNKISYMLWGLIPSFSKEKNLKFSTMNARAETVADTWSFREPFRHKRAIIPASFFYEPRKVGATKPHYPWYCFKLKNDEMFGMAGLYDIWKDKESGEEIYSYTIITTEPNDLVGEIHERMPVILKKEDEKMWLDSSLTDPIKLQPLLKSYPTKDMQGWHVGDDVKNYRNDSSELIKPVST